MLSWLFGHSVDKKVYGWKKDKIDTRDLAKTFDHYYDFDVIDLRNNCPPIYNQGHLGSCTANAIAGAYEYDMIKQKETPFIPSRLFIYFNERQMEDNIYTDSGAQIRDGMKTINKIGVVDEKKYPYIISKFKETPPPELYKDAKNHLAIKYERVEQNLKNLKECINRRFPVIFGFLVFENFKKDCYYNGKMKMPDKTERVLGGHAVLAVGYDNNKKVFIIRNSWGTSFGDNGYFYMPYEFILNKNFCSDFWTLERVKDIDNKEKKN